MTEFLCIELLNVYEGAVFIEPSWAKVMAEQTCHLQNKVSTSVGVIKYLIM